MKNGLKLLFLNSLASLTVASAAAPSCPEPISAVELQEQMKAMSSQFAKLSPAKPKDADEALENFPCTMRLLAYAQSKIANEKERIPAIVDLSVASYRFDDTNAAADTVIFDYVKNRRAYETEIDRQIKESKNERKERLNRFLIALRGYAQGLHEKNQETK